jgi:hypothetical protein
MASIWDDLESQGPSPEKTPVVKTDTGGSIWDSLEAPAPDLTKPKSRTVFGAANDYVIEFANAAASLPKAALDLASPGSRASEAIGEFIKEGEAKQSDVVKAAKAKLSKSMQSDSTMEEIKGAGQFVLENPLLSASMAAGSFVGPGFAVKGGKALGGALGLGSKGTTAAGTAAGSVTGGVLAGGDAAGSAYELVMNSPSLKDLPLAEREEMATEAARKAAVVPGIVGLVAGATGAEAALAKGISRGVARTAAKEFGTEAIEEGITQLSSNVAAGQFAPEIKPFQGVAGAATLGGLLGGGTGAAVGLATRSNSGSMLSDANDVGTETNTEAGAINKAIDSQTAVPTLDVTEVPKTPVEQAVQAAGSQQAQAVDAAAAQQSQEAEALAAEQQRLQKVNETRQSVFQKYGGTVQPLGQKSAYNFQGKIYYTENQLNQALDKLTEAEAQKSEVQLIVEGAYAAANRLVGGKMLTPVALQKAVAPYVDQAESKEEILARVELDLQQALQNVKSPQQLAKVEPLHALRDELAGIPVEQRVPTVDLLPKAEPKGKQDERLQLESDAGLRTVSEQGGAVEGDGTGTGVLRPSSVQPIQPGSVTQGQTSQQVGAVPAGGVRVGTDVSTTGGPSVQGGQDALQGKGKGQVNVSQVTAQTGRGSVSDQTATRDGTTTETVEETAEGIVKQVVNSIIDAVVVRKGRMKKADLAKFKDFIYYDFFQIENKKEGKDGLSKKELAQMFEVTPDTIDGWQKNAGAFFEENRGVIQQKILEALAQNNLTLDDLMDAVKARRDKVESDAVILEEGQALSEVTREDEEAIKGEVKEVAATDQELGTEEGVLDERDLAGENVGMSVNQGRVQGSIQEQGKPEETINARMKRLLEQYNDAVSSGDEKLEAQLMADIDELTKEAKKVADKQIAKAEALAPKKAAAPKKRKKVEDAVQEPSAEKVPVREGTGSSEGVRKEDTEKREAATESKTDEEIWDSLNTPVRYTDLTQQAKADWMLSVKNGKTNLAAANKVYEDNEGAITVEGKTRASLTFAKQDVMTSSSTKEKLSIATSTFDELAVAFPGLQSVKEQYESLGIGQAINSVEQWMVTDSPVSWDAIITLQDGKVTVIVNQAVFADKTVAAVAGSHEIGHAIDYAITHSGVYSASPSFNLYLGKDGSIKGMGDVAKEILGLYNTDSNWEFLLAYPLNRKEHGDLDANAVREELFAQLWSYMTNPTGREYLEQTAPKTFAFMQGVVNDVKEQNYGQAARQSLGRPEQGKSAQQRQADTGTEGRVQEVSTNAREARQAKNISKLPKQLQGPVSEITATINDLARRGVTYLAFTEDLANMAAKYIKSAKEYVALVREQQAVKTKYERRVDLILQQYDKLAGNLRGTGTGSVNAFLKASTMAGKWAFDPGYLKKAPEIDAGLQAQFDAMPKSAQDVVKAVFKHGFDTLQDMKKGVMDNITSEYDALIQAARDSNDTAELALLQGKKAKALKDYSTLMAVQAGKPYAPLKRFGNFVVVAKSDDYLEQEAIIKDKTATEEQKKEARSKLRELEKSEEHYYVSFAETKREGRKIEKELRTEGYGYVSEAFEKDSTKTDVYGGRDVQNVFYRLRNLANDSLDENTGDKSTKAINRLINDLHLTLLAEQSARQSERRRKGIAGAEDDMMRAFATQGMATAHFIATLHNSGKIYDSLQKMQREADAQTPGRDVRREYYNEFMKRHALGLDYQPNSILNKALGTSSFYMLLTNPAYYLQNMTQPFMLSLPSVAGKHGYDKSWVEFSKAYKEMFQLINKEGLSEESYAKLPADVRDAVETLVNSGRIDISLDQDLGRWRDNEGSKTELAGKAIEKLRGVAQDIESINRVATAVAAYRLEKASGSSTEQAIAYANQIILDTHGDYSGFNAPRITRQGLGRLATQFRKFQLIQISLMAKLVKKSFAGASPEEKMVARRALGFTLGHTLAAGGLMGFPGFAAIAWVMGAAFGDDDEPDNPELTLRRMIGNKELADVILKGAPKFFGVDLSGKLGMGQMLSILPYTDVDLSKAGIAQAGYALLTGPTGSLVQRAGEGLSLMADGEYYKGTEKFMPAAIAQSMKAARFGLMDGITLKNGDVVMKPDEISFLDMLSVAIGLPSNKITDRQFVQGVAIETDKFYKDRTGEIKRDYVKAVKEKDTAGMAKARQEWVELQNVKAKQKLTRQPLSDLMKAPQEQKKRERNVESGVPATKSNKQFIKEISKI